MDKISPKECEELPNQHERINEQDGQSQDDKPAFFCHACANEAIAGPLACLECPYGGN